MNGSLHFARAFPTRPVLFFGLLLSAVCILAQEVKPVPLEEIPRYGTFWSSQLKKSAPWPFYAPFLRKLNAPVYRLDGQPGVFVVDDSQVDYPARYKAWEAEKALRKVEWELGLMSDTEYWALEGGGPVVANSYAADDLWLEITGVTNPYVSLTLHGTVGGDYYQLLSKTNLAQPGEWKLGEIILGAYDTNQTDFSPVYVADDTNQFFRAQHAPGYIYIGRGPDAYEPNPVFNAGVGTFTIGASWSTNLTVYYRISGTASNGLDYTNLASSVLVPSGGTATISVQPLADSLPEGEETVTLTLVQTNNYLIDPAAAAATILIKDFSTLVQVGWSGDAVEADGPPGVPAQQATFTWRAFMNKGFRR